MSKEGLYPQGCKSPENKPDQMNPEQVKNIMFRFDIYVTLVYLDGYACHHRQEQQQYLHADQRHDF